MAGPFDVDLALLAPDFEPDGSLRDLYVLATDLDDWKMVLAFIEAGPFSMSLVRRDGPVTHRLPEDVHTLLVDGESLLTFRVGQSEFACHFFCEDEIEFDFWPHRVLEGDLEPILRFMKELGDRTGKTVVLCPENLMDRPIFRFVPGTPAPTWIDPRRR